MPKIITQFDGPFAVWSYTIGHGRLLVRRTKSGTHQTRVDVLFKDVGAISLPMSFDRLVIEERAEKDAQEIVQRLGVVKTTGRNVFALSGNGWQGQVIAGVVVWHEDTKEYNEPSALLE